jgi:DNA polymerase (family 10)
MLLADIGTLLELNGEDTFRARAFTNAARALEGVDADLTALALADELTSLRGIGSGIAGVVREFVLTGESSLHTRLRSSTPIGMYELLRVPGLGPKRIHSLYQELGVDGLDSLEEAARLGRIAALPGMGAKTEAKILEGIDFARSSRQMRRYPEALELAVRLVGWLRDHPDVQAAEIVGAVRRRMEVVDRIELVAASPNPGRVLKAFGALQGAPQGEALPDEVSLVLSDGMHARLRCVKPARFVAAVVWDTGSPAHVAALAERAAGLGGSFSPEGLVIGDSLKRPKDEEALYESLGLQYVPPELREGLGEVERAHTRSIPALVTAQDLSGTFHCHTTYSDGKATLEEMAEGARQRGWAYLGIADHSRTAGYAGGLSLEAVKKQQREIDRYNARQKEAGSDFRLFNGIESDILADGSLDYPVEVLANFDYVVGSVHSAFSMPREEMTKRLVRAALNPALTIIGHMTGRLLLTRDAYAVEVSEVLRAAAESGAVVEINANPHRLDLDWRYVREAAEMGILIAINPDAHSVAALDHVVFGVNMARKAGLEPRQVLNAWPIEEIVEYFAKRKQAIKT